MNRSKPIKILEVVSATIALLSTFMIAYGYPAIGFKLAVVASILFIVYNYITKQYALLVMSIIYLLIEIFGVKHWSSILSGGN